MAQPLFGIHGVPMVYARASSDSYVSMGAPYGMDMIARMLKVSKAELAKV